MKKILLVMPILVSCAASLVKDEGGEIKTIGRQTGRLADDGLYRPQFEAGAEQACGNTDYEVIERTRHPSTLSGQKLPKSMYYWVVRCSTAPRI